MKVENEKKEVPRSHDMYSHVHTPEGKKKKTVLSENKVV